MRFFAYSFLLFSFYVVGLIDSILIKFIVLKENSSLKTLFSSLKIIITYKNLSFNF